MCFFYKVYRNDPRNSTNEKQNVVKLFKHPLFNLTSMVADICLLKVREILNYPLYSFLIT